MNMKATFIAYPEKVRLASDYFSALKTFITQNDLNLEAKYHLFDGWVEDFWGPEKALDMARNNSWPDIKLLKQDSNLTDEEKKLLKKTGVSWKNNPNTNFTYLNEFKNNWYLNKDNIDGEKYDVKESDIMAAIEEFFCITDSNAGLQNSRTCLFECWWGAEKMKNDDFCGKLKSATHERLLQAILYHFHVIDNRAGLYGELNRAFQQFVRNTIGVPQDKWDNGIVRYYNVLELLRTQRNLCTHADERIKQYDTNQRKSLMEFICFAFIGLVCLLRKVSVLYADSYDAEELPEPFLIPEQPLSIIIKNVVPGIKKIVFKPTEEEEAYALEFNNNEKPTEIELPRHGGEKFEVRKYEPFFLDIWTENGCEHYSNQMDSGVWNADCKWEIIWPNTQDLINKNDTNNAKKVEEEVPQIEQQPTTETNGQQSQDVDTQSPNILPTEILYRLLKRTGPFSFDADIEGAKCSFEIAKDNHHAQMSILDFQTDYGLFWSDNIKPCSLTHCTTTGHIETLNIPKAIQYDGTLFVIIAINNHAFVGSHIAHIILPDSITTIKNRAFAECSELKSIYLPDSIENIGDEAFFNDKALTSIKIPKEIKDLAQGVFQNCDSLSKVESSPYLRDIGKSCFQGCKSLQELSFPHDLYSIGDSAFQGCDMLEKITLPDHMCYDHLGKYAFKGCSCLKEIVIPSGVRTINEGCFEGCTSLKIVNVKRNSSDWNLDIFNNAFAGCEQLETITIDENYDPKITIKQGAFHQCGKLVKIGKYTIDDIFEEERRIKQSNVINARPRIEAEEGAFDTKMIKKTGCSGCVTFLFFIAICIALVIAIGIKNEWPWIPVVYDWIWVNIIEPIQTKITAAREMLPLSE